MIAAFLGVATVAMPLLVPDDSVRQRLSEALARETGIELGEARAIRLALLPSPRAVLEDVMLRTPEIGATPAILAERFEAEIDPWALLRDRRLAMRRIVIEKPTVNFHVDASGRSNWERAEGQLRAPRYAVLGETPSSATAPIAERPARARRRPRLPASIEIRDGKLSYRDEVRRMSYEAAAITVTLRSAEGGLVTVDGGLNLGTRPVALRARLGGEGEVAPGSAPLTMEVSSTAFTVFYAGEAAWRGKPALRGQVRFELLSAAALGDMLGVRVLTALDGARLRGNLDAGPEGALVTGGKLTAKGAEGDFELAIAADGKTRFTLPRLALHGGSAAGNLDLDMQPRAVRIEGRLELADVDTISLLTTLSGFDWISGRAAGTLQLSASGPSLEAATAALQGEGRLTVTQGAVEGLDLPALMAKARAGEFKTWRRRSGQRTPFDSMAASFTVENGVAKTSDLVMTGPDIAVSGAGETNLARQRLDYRMKAIVTAMTEEEKAGGTAEAGTVAIPFLVRGDWSDPEIAPDLQGLAKDPDALLGTAKAFGKSVEKFTDGKIKSEDFGRALDALFGGKKKKDRE